MRRAYPLSVHILQKKRKRKSNRNRYRNHWIDWYEIGLTVKEYMFTILNSVEELSPLLHGAVITI